MPLLQNSNSGFSPIVTIHPRCITKDGTFGKGTKSGWKGRGRGGRGNVCCVVVCNSVSCIVCGGMRVREREQNKRSRYFSRE